jgi:thiamine pyrophosphate-dependent acetolactate synthase large subunit-like protein
VAGKKVLVVTTTVAEEEELQDALTEADRVRIVAPAAKVSRLAWLTGAEDDARAEADRAAQSAAEAALGQASVEVDPTSQNTDAAQDVDDALRTFDPDEVVVVTRAGEESTWLEDEALRKAVEDAGVPVRHLELPESG